MTELGQVEIKKRLLSGVVDCELLSDTYDLISALQAEILELKAAKHVIDNRCKILSKGLLFKNARIEELTVINEELSQRHVKDFNRRYTVKFPSQPNDTRTSRHRDDAVHTIKPSVYKTKSERDDD